MNSCTDACNICSDISVYIYYYGNSPPQWIVNIEKWPIGGYFHSNILFAIPMCIIHRYTVPTHYITMEIAPY